MKGQKVLLHSCCAPCLLYPYRKLKELGYQVSCFWYNPNVFPYMEKQKRFEMLRDYCIENGIEFYSVVSLPDDFFRGICLLRGLDNRCSRCWFVRLRRTALEAKQLGFDAFTTTLLVSKYQDPVEINRLGQIIAGQVGIKYLAFDFRDGFSWAHTQARQMKLYLQKWCGCIFSYNARLRAKRRRKNRKKGEVLTSAVRE